MKIEIKYDDLLTHLTEEMGFYPDDDDEPGYEQINYLMSERRTTIEQIHDCVGFRIDVENHILHCDTDWLHLIGELASFVGADYDRHFGDKQHPGGAWSVFGLGGDDDTDYNDGYISIILDGVLAYCAANNIQVKPHYRVIECLHDWAPHDHTGAAEACRRDPDEYCTRCGLER